MADVTYDYTITTVTPNGKVDAARLQQEIHLSNITLGVREISTIGSTLKVTFKNALSGEEPQIMTDILSAHSGKPLQEVQTLITKQDYPRGRGFRKTTPPLFSEEFMSKKWEFTCAEGKQVLFRKNKVLYNTMLQNMPNLLFEVLKKIGDDLFCVYQNFYPTLNELDTTSDKRWEYINPNEAHGSNIRLEFKFPNYSSVDRLPHFMGAGDTCRIYFTDTPKHGSSGDLSEIGYIHPIYGFFVYNEYTLSTNAPTFPDDFPERLKMAQVCVHCVSHNEGELV
jgi:hypothetical protein